MVKKRTSRVKRRRKRGGAMREAEDGSPEFNAARAAAATAEHRATAAARRATAEHHATAAETQAISITSSIPSVNKLDIGNLHLLIHEIIEEIIMLKGDVLRTTHPERISSLEGKESRLEELLNDTVPKKSSRTSTPAPLRA